MPSSAFKKIREYSAQELDEAVSIAVYYCRAEKDLDFYKILNGIDAYFERRSRKEAREQATHDNLLANLKESAEPKK